MVRQYIWILVLGIFSVGLISSANAQSNQDSEFDITDPLYLATFGTEKFPVHVSDKTFFVYYAYTQPPDVDDEVIKITNMSIIEESKSLVINIETAKRLTHTAFLFPDELINAEKHEFKLFVNGKEKNYELAHFSTHTVLDLMVEPGVKEIEIVGTYVIPEFEIIATMILMISILPIVIVSRFKNSGFRY